MNGKIGVDNKAKGLPGKGITLPALRMLKRSGRASF
jgi:hypothetical protein